MTVFDSRLLAGGVDRYLDVCEARFPDIRPGCQKRVVWHGARNAKTDVAILYVHGFSASSEEVRPLPDELAEALTANLVYTRLAGHGRRAAAMAEARLSDWMADIAEGLAVAQAVGRRVVVMGTSTGAALVTLALQEEQGRDLAGVVFISPNFRVRNRAAMLLHWPWARIWLPMIAGRSRGFAPRNESHARYWTTEYPSSALFPMAQAVRAARQAAHNQIVIPALFVFDEGDRIVDHRATRIVAARWRGPARYHAVTVGRRDDVDRHVIAGDILSPGMTAPLTDAILSWYQQQAVSQHMV